MNHAITALALALTRRLGLPRAMLDGGRLELPLSKADGPEAPLALPTALDVSPTTAPDSGRKMQSKNFPDSSCSN